MSREKDVAKPEAGADGPRRLVVLAGAGISAGAPSLVPSWWHFNEAVLRLIRDRGLDGIDLPADADQALRGLSLDDLDVTLFSQQISEAFAGIDWREALACLDAEVPNQCHDALAGLAASGRLAAVVTTNFDTLLERALTDAGVPFEIHHQGLTMPPWDLDSTDVLQIVKVHGSVDTVASMVDLMSHKLNGLPGIVRSWLIRAFASHDVVVLGFSGADLDITEDYLGLRAAAAEIPRLRWVRRPDRDPLPAAADLVASVPRGEFVSGDLPEVLEDVGIVVPSARTAPTQSPRVDAHLTGWLDRSQVGPEACAATLARLADGAGLTAPAESLRRELRTRISVTSTQGLTLLDAIAYAHALAIMGHDDIGRDDETALQDLLLSERLAQELDGHAGWSPAARNEQARNRSGILLNLAAIAVRAGRSADATALCDEALELLRSTGDGAPPERLSAAWIVRANVHALRGDLRRGLLASRLAVRMAREAGRPGLECQALGTWARLAHLDGQQAVADVLAHRRATVQLLHAGWLPDFHLPAPSMSEDVRFDRVLRRLPDEVRAGGERLDEVLFDVFDLIGRDPAGARADMARRAIGEVVESVWPVSPLAGMMLTLAATTLSPSDETTMATAERAHAWIVPLLSDLSTPPRLGQWIDLLIHPTLEATLSAAAPIWAQTGLELGRNNEYESAYSHLVTGGAAFMLVGDLAKTIQALLYAADQLAQDGQTAQAERMTEWLAGHAAPDQLGHVIARRMKFLALRAHEDGADLTALRPRVAELLGRLRAVGTAEELGVGLLYAAQTSAPQEALTLAEEALTLVEERHRPAALHLLDTLREETGTNAG